MQCLQKYYTEKLATSATEGTQMDIDPETTTDKRQLQELIKKQTLEETKNLHQELHRLKDPINTMKLKQQQQNGGKTQNKNKQPTTKQKLLR